VARGAADVADGGRRAGRVMDGVVGVVPGVVVVVVRGRLVGVDLDRGRVVRALDVRGVVARPVLDRVQAVVRVVARGGDRDVGRVAADGLDGAAVDRVVDLLDAGAAEGGAGRGIRRRGVHVHGAVVPVPGGVVAGGG